MPFNYKEINQVRERLLQRNAKWQTELDKITKGTKDPYVKALGSNVADVADELIAASTIQSDKIQENYDLAQKAVASCSAALESSSAALESQVQMTQDLKDKGLQIATNTKRGLKSIHERQKLELERSQTVVIGRGIQPLVEGKETYADLEAALAASLKKIGIKKGQISVSYLRRLNRSGGDKAKDKDPRALRIELSSIGDKIKLYEAMIEASSARRVEFSLTSEIPQYALAKYRRLSKLAKALRDSDKKWKTKVSIPRGKLQPVLQLKRRGSGEKYKPATEAQIKQATELWEKEKKSRDDALLGTDDEEMDTEPTAGGN